MRFQPKQISSEGKLWRTLFAHYVDSRLRLLAISNGFAGLQRMFGVCVGIRSRKVV
jgi:hypothetical protein